MANHLESRDLERDPHEAGAAATSPGKTSRTQRLRASAAAPDDRDRETLRRNLREALRDEVEKSAARLEQDLDSDAAWQAMTTGERDSAMALARMKLAEQAHQASLAELDARIAARHGDVQQIGHAAGNEGASQKATERAARGADADLRALDRARAAAEGVEAEDLTKAKPRKKPRIRKKTTSAGVDRTNRRDWRAVRDSWDAAGYGDALSPANRARIARGTAPIVDDAWVEYFPGDAALLGEPITIHHIKGLPLNVPLPFTRHHDAHMPGGTQGNPGGPGMTGSLDDDHRGPDDLDEDQDDGIAYA